VEEPIEDRDAVIKLFNSSKAAEKYEFLDIMGTVIKNFDRADPADLAHSANSSNTANTADLADPAHSIILPDLTKPAKTPPLLSPA
jgi:hypothetical protein